MGERKEKQWCVSKFSHREGRYVPKWQFDSRDQAFKEIATKRTPSLYIVDPITRGPRA
jgi:hypothetical protein